MPQRAHVEYVVEPDELHWTVSLQGEHCGRYDDCRTAMEAAIGDARRVRERGHEIHVHVRRRNGSLRPLPDRLLKP